MVLVILAANASVASAAAGDAGFHVVADFEPGVPSGFVGFADSWDGSGSATTLAVTTAIVDLPVVPGGAGSTAVSVTYNIAASGSWGGGPGYGGITHDFASTEDWSTYQTFCMWFAGSNSGASIRLELKADGPNAADSNRYVYSFVDDVAGWRFFNVPFSDFVQRTDFNPGPSPTDPINLSRIWGYAILLPGGSSGTFTLDQVAITAASFGFDFESGLPSGFVAFADSWDGSGSSTTLVMVTAVVDLPMVPGGAGSTAVSVTYDIAASGSWGGGPGYGGVTHDFASTEDWSTFQGFSIFFDGSASGASIRIELKSDGTGPGTSNRYEYTFVDDVAGWRFFNVPFSSFVQRTDFNPGPSPTDPINLSRIWGYAILLPGGSSGTFTLDQVTVWGVGGPVPVELMGFDVD